MRRILLSMSLVFLAACGGGKSSEYTFDLTNRVAQAYPAKCSNGIVSTELKFSSNGGQFLRGTDSVDENNDGTCTAKPTAADEVGVESSYAISKVAVF